MTGNEVCEYLHISPRTLQTLRSTGQISYSVVCGRMFLYPEKGIKEVLENNYREAEKF